MTLTAAGFPGSVNDIQWATLMDLIGNDGTVGMNVSAAGGDRTVSVSSGVSNVGGILATLDASQTEGPLPANTSSNPRIDRIILRARWSNRLLQLTHRAGTPSPNPRPPTLVRDRGVQWEVSLAQVRVGPGQGAITSGDITRENTPPATGFYAIGSIAQAPDPELGAAIFYIPQSSLRLPVNGKYVEIAHGRTRVETAFGIDTNIDLDGQGVGVIQHNLGWTPAHMTFNVYLPSGVGQSILVEPRFAANPFNSTQAQIVAKSTVSGDPVTSSLSKVGWTAYRNVSP